MRRRYLGVKPLETEVMRIRTWTGAASTGAGPAPVDAQYVVMAVNADLTAERVLTAGNSITITDGGAGGTVTLALATPGTCAVASVNSAVAPHTHAITSSSAPGVAASILASSAAGALTLSGLLTLTAGITFNGATAANVLTVPDNVAQALHMVDVGGIEYLRIISTNTQPIIRFNDGGADVDFFVESDTLTDALVVQGSDGQITLGILTAGYVKSDASGVLSSGTIATGDVAALAAQFVCLAASGDLANERVLTAGNSITITDGGAGGTVTVALATPGTCAVASVNSAVAPHTHAITSSSAPGVAASILASSAAGALTLSGLLTLTAGITFNGATAANVLTVPDNVAQALHMVDVGGIEYLRIISTNTQPIIRFNDGGADVDFFVESDTLTDALVVQGSDGQITLGILTAGYVKSDASGVLSSGTIATGDVAALAAQFVCLAASGDLANERVLTAGNSISITDGGAGGTVTVALATPGTCTATSVNSAGAPHTHAVTTTAVGAASTIMATDANGRVQVDGLGINVAAAADGQITMADGGNIGVTGDVLVTWDTGNNFLEIMGCNVGIGITSPTAPLHVVVSDAATNTQSAVAVFDHITSDTPAALFGTSIYLNAETTTGADRWMANITGLWTDATDASRNALLRFATATVGSIIGYTGQWTGNDVGAAAQTIIPNGAGDVTALLDVVALVVTSGGATGYAVGQPTPGGAALNLYNVAGDTLQLTVVADGSVTVARSAGALTYDVLLWMKWI